MKITPDMVEAMVKCLRDPFPSESLTRAGGIDYWREIMRKALSAALSSRDVTEEPVAVKALEWQPIETYHAADKFVKVEHVLCGHSEGKWMRFGRYYPEMKRWYYSGTSERSQWAQVEGDAPTHWQPLPKPPTSSGGFTE